jgi:hypothetical protein
VGLAIERAGHFLQEHYAAFRGSVNFPFFEKLRKLAFVFSNDLEEFRKS